MRNSSLVFGGCLALGLLAVPLTAAADIPPPGLCASDEVGEVCDDAIDKNGTELGEPGICMAEECTRGTPNGPMKYACVMCRPESTEPTDGGAGGAANYPTEPSAGAAGSAATAGETGKDDGGCSIGLGGQRSGVVSVSSLLALALVLGRRRWQRRA